MADDNTSPNAAAHTGSTSTSPTDTRWRRFEPITPEHADDDDDGGEEKITTAGTTRRKRPPAISTSSGDNYGMFSFHSRGLLLTVSKAP